MTQMGHAAAGTPPSDTFEIHLTQQLTLTNLVNEAGLSEIARAAGGDSFVVCDLNTHGVQGCADLRAALDDQKMAAELVAIGLMILVAVLVGTIADHEAVPASGTRNLRESCLIHQIGQGQLLREVNVDSV